MKKDIICLETEWDFNKHKLQDKFSAEGMLIFLKSFYDVDYIYRRVSTRAELEYYLKSFKLKRFASYKLVYFSFHGTQNAIHLEGERGEAGRLQFDELIDMSHGCFENKLVHFSSCRTLLGASAPIESFKEESNAMIVSGYRKNVDCMKSAIHDLAYFNELQKRSRMAPTILKNAMNKLYGGLCEELGFEII